MLQLTPSFFILHSSLFIAAGISMNLFQLDFIQGKTDAADYGEIVHSLTDTATERQIITLSLSGDKLQGISNYSREPRRLTFECFADAWITEYLLSGTYEHERYISHYEVKLYRDTVLVFSGIIDTSQIKDSGADQPLQFLCYDKLKLLSLFADLTQLYSLTAGYTAPQILGYFLAKIEAAIPVSIPYSSTLFAIPSLDISGSTYGDMKQLSATDYSEMNTLPEGGGYTWTWTSDSWTTPKFGYIVNTPANVITFIFANKQYVKGLYPNGDGTFTVTYQARYLARIHTYYNGICAHVFEYENTTDWQGFLFGPSSESDIAFRQFFVDNGFAEDVYDDVVNPEDSMDSHYAAWAIDEVVYSAYHGETFPTELHPGKYYIERKGTELTNCLQVLQVALMLYNATLVCTAAGTLALISKHPASATPIAIANTDVISISRSRQRPELPETSIFDVLAGDTTILQSISKDYLLLYHASIWMADIIIDRIDAYALALHTHITVNSITYYIVELEKDFINDEYKVKAWQTS